MLWLDKILAPAITSSALMSESRLRSGELIACSATRWRRQNGKRRLPQTLIVGGKIVAAWVHREATVGKPLSGLGDILVFNQFKTYFAETIVGTSISNFFDNVLNTIVTELLANNWIGRFNF